MINNRLCTSDFIFLYDLYNNKKRGTELLLYYHYKQRC